MIIKHFTAVFGTMAVLAALVAPAKAQISEVLAGKLQVCDVCHGSDGRARTEGAPVIWGQQENYLIKQLQDFQSGDRKSEVMTWIAKTLAQAELAPAAAYFAKKTWPARGAGTPAAPQPAGVAVCQSCHQQDLAGGLAAPRLAGQPYDYLVATMRRYADGERTNNPVMVAIMKAMPAAEREATARYLAGL